jgi:hypothetical protein
VEAELLRLQQKSTVLNTVEARHQEVRQPNAPGVAQKRPKVGHPPKKNQGESSNSTKKGAETSHPIKKSAASGKLSLIVKMSYRRKFGTDITRLLRTRGTPWKEFKALEAKRLETERHPPEESESEEDIPLHQRRGTKTPALPPSKKRPVEPSDRVEPGPKRTKVPARLDTQKSSSTPLAPAFKSPAPSVSKEKNLLATPKKGDAMKSVAMRRVDSGDGHARTPQALSSSAPASAEKPRISSEELSRARQEDAKFMSLGTTLKRKLQAMVQKEESVSELERKSSVMRGVESLMAYMIAFNARERYNRSPPNPEFWEQFFPILLFVTTHAKRYPELIALVDNLGAISREQLNRIYLEQPKESRDMTWEKLATSSKDRVRLWHRCKMGETYISNLGVQGALGPWSTVDEAVSFGVMTLKKYAISQKLQWEGDSHFADVHTKPSISSQTAGKKPMPQEV